jgi:predicted nucleotidyltransferase
MQHLTVKKIKEKIIPILKEAGVTRSALFGSYVRGEENEASDIDILVDYPEGKSLFDFISTKMELEDVLGKRVDLVEYKTIKPRLKDYILSEQLQIL